MKPMINIWETDTDLPHTLHELLEETEINNSFDNLSVTDHLIESMESSYSYMYRFQRDSVPYRKFHYQTREYLLKTTYSEIQSGLQKYTKELEELEISDTPDYDRIAELKKIMAEYGEVKFGDLYLDKDCRVCVDVPYDMIESAARAIFRRSDLFNKKLTLTDVSENNKYFHMIPTVILDNQVRPDIYVVPFEKGTKIIFRNTKASDLYNSTESQKFHDIAILFTRNLFFDQCQIVGECLNEFKQDTSIISSGQIPFKEKFDRITADRKGILFCTITFSDGDCSVILETESVSNGFRIQVDPGTTSKIQDEEVSLVFSFVFFDELHKHSYYNSPDGSVPCISYTVVDGDNRSEKIESMFFIPLADDLNPYKMPIPEESFFIFKENLTDNTRGYLLEYDVSVNIHYPNMYQVLDVSMKASSRYLVYYFYNDEPTMQYTPLYDFYEGYLRTHYNNRYSLECMINMVYFKLPGYNYNNYLIDIEGVNPDSAPALVEGSILQDFYDIFMKILYYRDYNYIYGTPDFMEQYNGDDIPLQYKIARMREFVRGDHKILNGYIKRQQDKTHLFHFFVNSVELRGRFRRSTRTEDLYNPRAFANSFTKCAPGLVGSFKVVDNISYNPIKEIHIDDVHILNSSIVVGDYVTASNLRDRYVFTFRNDELGVPLPIKVYVDGLLCADYETIHLLGMDYIYIPTSAISEDSYVLIEEEFSMIEPQVLSETFSSQDTWVEFHFLETNNLSYTMNDIMVRYCNGLLINRELYDIEIVKNQIPYNMTDMGTGSVNKYANMTDVRIRLSRVPFNGEPLVVNVVLNKVSYIASTVATECGYPKFDLMTLRSNPDMKFARMYYNGRLVPSICYRFVSSAGKNFMQSRIFCRPGDEFLFEFSPYAREIICEIDEFDQNEIFDFTTMIDKPIDIEYYEVFVNGRRLGLPNVFEFGPHHGVFRGLHSKYLLTIYEKERDYEYFGYRKININKDNETYHYFFEPIDLVKCSFMTDGEKKQIVDNYIAGIKNPNVIIRDNVDDEIPITYEIDNSIAEEMKIFYYGELLPLSLGDPNSLQFITQYMSDVFPTLTKEFQLTIRDSNVVYLDPNKTARVIDKASGEYEMISTRDMDIQKSTVVLTGEEDFTNLLIAEGEIDVPVNEFETEYTFEVYAVENIYIEKPKTTIPRKDGI